MTDLDPSLVEALHSARRIVSADPRDWGANRHDAFLYGVFRGWDEEFVARMHRLQSAVAKALS